jgi:hypothetical protein
VADRTDDAWRPDRLAVRRHRNRARTGTQFAERFTGARTAGAKRGSPSLNRLDDCRLFHIEQGGLKVGDLTDTQGNVLGKTVL